MKPERFKKFEEWYDIRIGFYSMGRPYQKMIEEFELRHVNIIYLNYRTYLFDQSSARDLFFNHTQLNKLSYDVIIYALLNINKNKLLYCTEGSLFKH
jgi:hypothetical protein